MAKKNKTKTIFEVTDALRMFPTFVWKADLETNVYRTINENIIATLDGMRRTQPELASGQPWQSDRGLHKLKEFGELVSCLNAAVANVLDFLKIGRQDFEITGAWANMNPPDAAHGMHSQPR